MTPLLIIEHLVNALKHTEKRKEYVKEFQDTVWSYLNKSDEEQLTGVWGILSDLAYDLDFYEPNPDWRREESSLFGEERAEELIRMALKKLKDIGYVISDEEEII